jgi:hypothetical protein
VTVYTTQASFNVAVPGAVLLEDFSSALPNNVPITTPLVLPSGTYTGLAGSPSPNVFVAPPGFNNFGADVGITTQFILTANGDENIIVHLAAPTHALGFNAFFNGLGLVTVNVLSTGGFTLAAVFNVNGLDPATGLADPGYLGFTSDDFLISAFIWTSTNGGTLNTGFTAISTVPEVPLPAALPLFASGLGALGLLGWRRKKKTAALV